MGALSWWHWLIIIAAFILIFGAKKLPDAARGVGRSLRILKSEVSAMHEDGAKPETSSETGTSSAASTPPSQITATPMETAQAPPAAPQAMPQTAPPAEPQAAPAAAPQAAPPAAAPQAAPAAAPPAAPQQPADEVPVINGTPASQQQTQ